MIESIVAAAAAAALCENKIKIGNDSAAYAHTT